MKHQDTSMKFIIMLKNGGTVVKQKKQEKNSAKNTLSRLQNQGLGNISTI